MTIAEVIRGRADGSRGRELRQAAGLSLREVAAELGVSEAGVCRWETGISKPRRDAAVRYHRLLEQIRAEVADAC